MIRKKLLALIIASATIPLAAFAEPSAKILSQLPSAATWSLSPMFMANAIGQTGLNGQRDTSPEKLLNQLRQTLEKAGYSEQPIRTTVGAWGFSATWALPEGVKIDGTNSGQEAVLVTQATALATNKTNLNIRFDGIAPIKSQQQESQQAETKEDTKPTTNININIPSPRRFF